METLRQFAEEAVGKIKEYLPEEYRDVECGIVERIKNNGVYWTGISFKKPADPNSMTIYMEDCFGEYKKGMPFDKVMEEMAGKIADHLGMGPELYIERTEDFESVKDFLEPVLINTKANRKVLQDTPCMAAADLSVVCRAVLPMKDGQGSIEVKGIHLEKWGIEKKQLFEQAFENMEKPGMCTLQRMDLCMLGAIGGTVEDNLLESPEPSIKKAGLPKDTAGGEMFVLTNKSKSFGAAAMVCPGVMEKVKSLFPEGFYILPSSVHECLIIRKDEQLKVKELEQMVFEVNRTAVEAHDRLSDHVYEYDREKGSICLAAKALEKERGMER